MHMTTALLVAGGALLANALPALAQVPGEDPLILQRKQTVQMLPLGSAPKSIAPSLNTDMPAWQRAKVARYEAKAFNLDTGAVQTGEDVINTAKSDGFKTTCTQSIASTAVPKGSTLKSGTEQIVVLRGDLVNICN
jgi:hypothetical protein